MTCRYCPVCKSSDSQELCVLDMGKDTYLPEVYRVVRCSDCNFVFDDFDANERNFCLHYQHSSKYSDIQLGGGGGALTWDRENWRIIFEDIAPFLKNKDTSILDVGCGKGGLLTYFKQQGFTDLTGVDPSADCIHELREAGIQGYVGFLSVLPKGRKYEVVLLTGVLEHVFHPHELLHDICEHLTDDGYLYIVVPDADCYCYYTAAPFYFFDREHINHFTNTSLETILSMHSFALKHISNLNMRHTEKHDLANIFALFQNQRILYSSDSVARYVKESQQRLSALQIPSIGKDIPVYVWGIGAFARNALENGLFKSCNLVGLIDVDQSIIGKKIHGVEVFSPEKLIEVNQENAVVIIASVAYCHDIRRQLVDMNWLGQILSIVG